MKKKLIALAVAGAMTAPMAAMADVKISGGLQSQLVSQSGDLGILNGLYLSHGGGVAGQNAGSFGDLTINASEDLGNGLTALAKYGFNIGTGAGIDTREAYVGLAGGFGAVLAGRLNHPYKTSTIGWDPFLSTFLQARTAGGVTAAGHGGELDNALAYAGSFGGVTVIAATVLDEGPNPDDAEKTNGKHATSFSVNAPVGPVDVAVAYLNVSKHSEFGYGENLTAVKVGVKYAAGDFSVAGQVESLGKGFSGVDKSGNVMYLTGTYKMGANSLSASFGQHSKQLLDDENAMTYVAVGVNHAFSAKTSAYAGVRQTSFDGDKDQVIGAGMRVRF